MKAFLPIFLLSFCWNKSLIAQSEGLKDSIQTIVQKTYEYNNDVAILSILKKSVYDTNQILTRQDRYNYISVDTGLAVGTHYWFEYNPKNRYGSYTNKTLAHSTLPNRKESQQLTEFRSFDHEHKREWIKTYKKDSKDLLRHIEQKFDAKGHSINSKMTNYETKTPSISTEKVQRNAAGNITFWESFDDDGDSKMQARSYQAEYKNDTIFLSSGGYLYNTWTAVVNKYNRKNELLKTTTSMGTRQSNGKIKITTQTVIDYSDNKPSKSITKNLNKVVETILFVYQDGKKIQQISTPEKKYEWIESYTYLDSTATLLTSYTNIQEGKIFKKEELSYDSLNQLVQHIEIEYRANGKDWKTITEYNSFGKVSRIRFYIADILNKEDIYKYEYHSNQKPN